MQFISWSKLAGITSKHQARGSAVLVSSLCFSPTGKATRARRKRWEEITPLQPFIILELSTTLARLGWAMAEQTEEFGFPRNRCWSRWGLSDGGTQPVRECRGQQGENHCPELSESRKTPSLWHLIISCIEGRLKRAHGTWRLQAAALHSVFWWNYFSFSLGNKFCIEGT